MNGFQGYNWKFWMHDVGSRIGPLCIEVPTHIHNVAAEFCQPHVHSAVEISIGKISEPYVENCHFYDLVRGSYPPSAQLRCYFDHRARLQNARLFQVFFYQSGLTVCIFVDVADIRASFF
jgi:hypothetical protein